MTRRRSAVLGGALVATALLIGALVTWLGAPGFDEPVLQAFHQLADTPFMPLFEAASGAGSLVIWIPALGAVAVTMYVATGRLAPAVYLLLAPLIASVTNAVLKRVFDRERPNLDPEHALESLSMPSGHAATSAAMATAIVLVVPARHRALAIYAAGAGALVTGVSRMVLGVHWPTDVVAGWCYGAGVALLLWAPLARR